MLQPKRVKFRRPHGIKYEGLSKGGNEVSFGEFGLQAVDGAWVTARQIESARIVLSRYTRKEGKVYVRIFPHLAKTKKPAEVRMGSGKGSPEEWVAVVKTNRVMFEMGGIPEATAREALRLASYKLPCRCRVISKKEEKQMKVKELRELTNEELNNKIYSLKEELFNLRRKKAVGQLEHGEEVRRVRKDIARAYMVQRERELGIK